jgi:hypothetical protein
MLNKLLTTLALSVSCSIAFADLENGAVFRLFNVGKSMDKLCTIKSGQLANTAVKINKISFREDDFEPWKEQKQFIAEITFKLVVPEAGEYILKLKSDDGAVLELDNKLVLNNDGIHSDFAEFKYLNLEAKTYDVKIRHFQNEGSKALQLTWATPQTPLKNGIKSFENIPADLMFIDQNESLEVSEGIKEIDCK